MGMDGRRRGHGEPRIIISRRRPGIRAEKLVFVAWALCPRDGLTNSPWYWFDRSVSATMVCKRGEEEKRKRKKRKRSVKKRNSFVPPASLWISPGGSVPCLVRKL